MMEGGVSSSMLSLVFVGMWASVVLCLLNLLSLQAALNLAARQGALRAESTKDYPRLRLTADVCEQGGLTEMSRSDHDAPSRLTRRATVQITISVLVGDGLGLGINVSAKYARSPQATGE